MSARLEFLGYATDYIDDANRDFKTVLEACLDEIKRDGKTDMSDKQDSLEAAENNLKAGLRMLEIFKKGDTENGSS